MLKLFIQSSKTDQYRDGAWIVASSMKATCPVAMMNRYLDRTGLLFGIEIEGPAGGNTLYVKPLEDLVQACSCFEKRLEDFDSKPD